MKIETPENFDDGVTQVAPKIKTLKEKREELLNKNIRFVDKTCKRLVLEIVEKQDKEFIKEILDEMEKGIKLTIKFYNHKNGEELGEEIYNYLYKIIKDNSGFDK